MGQNKQKEPKQECISGSYLDLLLLCLSWAKETWKYRCCRAWNQSHYRRVSFSFPGFCLLRFHSFFPHPPRLVPFWCTTDLDSFLNFRFVISPKDRFLMTLLCPHENCRLVTCILRALHFWDTTHLARSQRLKPHYSEMPMRVGRWIEH